MTDWATGQIVLMAVTHLGALGLGGLAIYLIQGQRCNYHHHVEDEHDRR